MARKLKSDVEKQQVRIAILDAARELFVHHGVEAVTMREVAKQVGYTATTLYAYFEDKEALLRALLDADVMLLAVSLKQTLQMPDPKQRLLAFGRQYIQFALNQPNHYRMVFMTAHPPCLPEASSIEQFNPEQDAYFQLTSVVQAALDAGIFRPTLNDASLIAQTLWAAIHGLCALHINMADDAWIDWRPLDARIEAMLSMTVLGLMKEEH